MSSKTDSHPHCHWDEFSKLEYKDILGNTIKMDSFKDKTLMIVNVASNCGFTKQYESLEKLYKKYKDKNFEIIAFPTNEFGGQEPGNDKEIYDFCKTNYDVSFSIASKTLVNGENSHPIYKYLKDNLSFLWQKPNFRVPVKNSLEVDWNFEKFIIYKDNTIFHYGSEITPDELESEIEIDKSLKEIIEEKIEVAFDISNAIPLVDDEKNSVYLFKSIISKEICDEIIASPGQNKSNVVLSGDDRGYVHKTEYFPDVKLPSIVSEKISSFINDGGATVARGFVLCNTPKGVPWFDHKDENDCVAEVMARRERGSVIKTWGGVLYLNSCEGGQLVYPENGMVKYSPQPGDMILHDVKILHRVEPPLSDKRYTITFYMEKTF